MTKTDELTLARSLPPGDLRGLAQAGRRGAQGRAVREAGQQDLRRAEDRPDLSPRAGARRSGPRRGRALADHAADRSSRCEGGQCAGAARSGERRDGPDAGVRRRQWRPWFGLDPSAEAVAQVLDGIHLDAGIGIELPDRPQSRMAAIHVAEYIKRKGSTRQPAISGSVSTRSGPRAAGRAHMPGPRSSPRSPARSQGSPRWASRAVVAVADGRVMHDAGGSEVQELAFALASRVAYLRAIEQAGSRSMRRRAWSSRGSAPMPTSF